MQQSAASDDVHVGVIKNKEGWLTCKAHVSRPHHAFGAMTPICVLMKTGKARDKDVIAANAGCTPLGHGLW